MPFHENQPYTVDLLDKINVLESQLKNVAVLYEEMAIRNENEKSTSNGIQGLNESRGITIDDILGKEDSQKEVPAFQERMESHNKVNIIAYCQGKPMVDKFSIGIGKDWNKWLNKFEAVMKVTLDTLPESWIHELGNHLEGSMKEKFNNIKNFDLGYDQVIGMLTKYVNYKNKINISDANSFDLIQKTPDMSLSSFMTKLECAYF